MLDHALRLVLHETRKTSHCVNERLLETAVVYTGDDEPDDETLFVVEKKAFRSLCRCLVNHADAHLCLRGLYVFFYEGIGSNCMCPNFTFIFLLTV